MAQMGMQMQGGGMRKRGPELNVYTGLAFVAFACLAAACVMVFLAAQKVGKNGSPLEIQEKGKIVLVKPAK